MAILPNIPAEIFGEIFYLVLRGPISNNQESLFPWNLGRVCKSWRHAFVTYPKLWAFISLDVITVDDDANLEKICNRFLLCLQRSGNHPLSLILCAREKIDGDQRSPWMQAWKAFLSCSQRWKNIVLYGEALQFRDLTIECKGGFPLLQSFTLCSYKHSACDAFHDAPRLTQFGLVYYENLPVSHAWSFPLSQLTKFTLAMNGISSDALQVLLENLHNIQELCFKASGCNWTPDISPFPPRYLEHLRVLEVHYVQILQVIKAPSLVELRLETASDIYPVGEDGYEMFDFYRKVVEAFIELSSCHLRKLVLTGFLIEQTKPLINSFPNLEELCIDERYEFSCALLGPLNDDASSFNEELESTAFPNLRILTLNCESCRTEDIIGVLTGILEFRNGVYIGKPSIQLRPLEKIIIKRRHAWHPVPDFYDSKPIPDELEDAMLEWAPFKVEVKFDQ